MLPYLRYLAAGIACVFVGALDDSARAADEALLQLNQRDHVAIIGNTLADRMQHHGWLETMIHSRFAQHELVFRNLGFPGDEVKTRPRSANFGSPQQWLTKVEADVVFCFFGYNEALRGKEVRRPEVREVRRPEAEGATAAFENDLGGMLDGMLKQKFNGKSPPRIVVFSPIAHENLNSPHLPDGTENNQNLELYTQAMAKVCAAKGVPFVDLFHPTQALYQAADKPLTLNGVHLLEHGNRALAEVIDRALFGPRGTASLAAGGTASLAAGGTVDRRQLERLREAILDRNYHWFSRYRVVDGYNVYGGRSGLAWHGQSNADVMRREMEAFDVMTANRDRRVWTVAKGGEMKVVDDNLPEQLAVKPNRTGPLEGGAFPYLGGQEAIEKMKVHEGMQINLFASEEMFPEIVNPVQMAVDTDSRLWVSCWQSYPHWNPAKPRKDKIVILPDEDGDGVADKCITFADQLNTVTGFEIWGGGVLVMAPPEIWFLKDTDGDDRADLRLRVLQGISSADTHHSANSVLIGPDGWLYWSRGIFNVANMETPTRTYRSGRSGVHRFNPRTFEVEFHFPIGPNPHGDVVDRWGYQFANDGTGGTGCYVNLGKGIGNKQWFRKRVRPVAATGIFSSSHFPDAHQGNFLICNVIGVLGVLQHEVQYDGADITAVEIDPIVVSSDPNFRPSDVEIGGDGALYIADWHNALIGHMQHNMRDPNRDDTHGRIYRVTYPGRPLLKPAKMKGKPVEEVCENFFAPENGTRYRARLELSSRVTGEALAKVSAFAAGLNPRGAKTDRDSEVRRPEVSVVRRPEVSEVRRPEVSEVRRPEVEAQAMLECLWVFEEHRVPNVELAKRVFTAEDARVRAAAIRTLGHWAGKVDGWESTLSAAARDGSALVRAEAAKAAVEFGGLASAEVIFEVATHPLDPELEVVLKYARGRLNVDQIAQDAVKSGKPLSQAAQLYVLRNAGPDDLVKLEPTEAVYRAILSRASAKAEHLAYAIAGLAKARNVGELDLLIDLVVEEDAKEETAVISAASEMLLAQSADALKPARERFRQIATKSQTPAARRLGFAGWMAADGSGDAAFEAAMSRAESLAAVLAAVPMVRDEAVRRGLYPLVQPLMFDLPASIDPRETPSGGGESGLAVDYFLPHSNDAALATLAKRKPTASGLAKDVSLGADVITQRDGFALRFTGSIGVDKGGKYTFYLNSDDGSRLYIGGEEIINNDGLHGMAEKSGSVTLSPGAHPIVVTYFDNGGGDGLALTWSGPGIKGKKAVEPERFSTGGGQTLHDVAVAAAAGIPGHEAEKFRDLAALIKSNRSRVSAVRVIKGIDQAHWDRRQVGPLVDSLVAHLSQLPANRRTSPAAIDAIALVKSLATRLPEDQARAVTARLANLDVRVIAIGTVPARMIYDKMRIVVEAGKPVEFRFSNVDDMPHNLSVALPGSMEEIGTLAEDTAQDPDAIQRHYIPKSHKILVSSRLLQPGESQAISFVAPKEPGVYPVICTYPGHWRRMHAALYVTEDLDAYEKDPAAFYAANESQIQDELLLLIGKEYEWTVEELLDSVKPFSGARSFEVAQSVFKVASCIACHRMGAKEGLQVGPDLTELDTTKKNAEALLRSLITPSETIEEKYQSHVFLLDSGKIVTGMILEEDDKTVTVIENPLADTKPLVIEKVEIDEREKTTLSIMPEALVNKLNREEILDLIAYVHAQGDKNHKVFQDEGGHQGGPEVSGHGGQ